MEFGLPGLSQCFQSLAPVARGPPFFLSASGGECRGGRPVSLRDISSTPPGVTWPGHQEREQCRPLHQQRVARAKEPQNREIVAVVTMLHKKKKTSTWKLHVLACVLGDASTLHGPSRHAWRRDIFSRQPCTDCTSEQTTHTTHPQITPLSTGEPGSTSTAVPSTDSCGHAVATRVS